MNLTVVEENFLDEEERSEIQESVLGLIPSHGFPKYLGDPRALNVPRMLYMSHNDLKKYEKSNKRSRSVMIQNFDWLYFKFKERLEEYYSRPVEYSSTLMFPAFRVFRGECDSREYPMSLLCLPPHVDIFPTVEELRGTTIESWVCPINLPKHPTGIYYEEDDEEKEHVYTVGSLVHWKAMTPHRTSDIVCETGESRISFHSHARIEEGRVTLFS